MPSVLAAAIISVRFGVLAIGPFVGNDSFTHRRLVRASTPISCRIFRDIHFLVLLGIHEIPS